MNDESLETRIGSRWLLYVGIVAIVSTIPRAIPSRGAVAAVATRARAAI